MWKMALALGRNTFDELEVGDGSLAGAAGGC